MRIIMLSALVALSACGEGERAATSGGCPPGVTIVDAWTKPARAGQPVSAAYVTICNGSGADDALVGVANVAEPVAGAIEVHTSEMTDGVMSMKQVKQIALPAGEKTTFEPGGAHIMLIGVESDIAKGAEPTLRLDFENAEPIHWAFEVRGETDKGEHAHH